MWHPNFLDWPFIKRLMELADPPAQPSNPTRETGARVRTTVEPDTEGLLDRFDTARGEGVLDEHTIDRLEGIENLDRLPDD